MSYFTQTVGVHQPTQLRLRIEETEGGAKRLRVDRADLSRVTLLDVATQLARLPRYGGGGRRHYSVAEHSLLLAIAYEEDDPELARFLLFHDAAEIVSSDIPRPVKDALGAREALDALQDDFYRQFAGAVPDEEVRRHVSAVDELAVHQERAMLWPDSHAFEANAACAASMRYADFLRNRATDEEAVQTARQYVDFLRHGLALDFPESPTEAEVVEGFSGCAGRLSRAPGASSADSAEKDRPAA